jgi:hypothetical protein
VAGGLKGVALPVVLAGGTVLFVAVFGLLFQPAIKIIAIRTRTARPAIQPHMPVLVSVRRIGLLRGSVMTTSVGSNALVLKPPEKLMGSSPTQ